MEQNGNSKKIKKLSHTVKVKIFSHEVDSNALKINRIS